MDNVRFMTAPLHFTGFGYARLVPLPKWKKRKSPGQARQRYTSATTAAIADLAFGELYSRARMAIRRA
jgi:hypothetical protein